MQHSLRLQIQAQPTDSTCGPTCLQSVYSFYDDHVDLSQVIEEVGQLPNGGTMAVQLACHALTRGYEATIYTYNLLLFDPTWFVRHADNTSERRELLAEKLSRQAEVKGNFDERIGPATEAYLKYLRLGGQLRMEPLEAELLIRSLSANVPVLSGLSATFLYQEPRERSHPPNPFGRSSIPDDVGGEPAGHFVVLSGYDPQSRQVLVSDPLAKNPFSATSSYSMPLANVAAAILLGIVTYDANLLMIQKLK